MIKMLWSIKVRHSSQRVSTQGKFQLSLLKQQLNLNMFILMHSEIVYCIMWADFNFTVFQLGPGNGHVYLYTTPLFFWSIFATGIPAANAADHVKFDTTNICWALIKSQALTWQVVENFLPCRSLQPNEECIPQGRRHAVAFWSIPLSQKGMILPSWMGSFVYIRVHFSVFHSKYTHWG